MSRKRLFYRYIFFSVYLIIQKTPLYIAVEKENINLVQLLLSNKKINVNEYSALN